MAREWTLEAEVKLNNRTMEEMVIEAFGCIPVNQRVIRIYVSGDKRLMRRDFCINGNVVDSQTTPLARLIEESQFGLIEQMLIAA